MAVGVGRGGADGRVWSRSNDGEESLHPSVGVGGEVWGEEGGRWAMRWVWGVAWAVVGGVRGDIPVV